VIAALLVIVDLGLERLSPQTEIPAISGSRVMTRFVLAGAAALFMALKFLFHLGHFSNLGIGFWIGVVLVAALLYFTMQARQTEGVSPSQPAGPPPAAAGPPGSAGPPPLA
jgi:drug/metabolite transporter (DMT)-like permease